MNEVKSIKISDLISAPNNPFKVTLDVEMERLIESIAETGIIAPIIVRPTKNGKYEIVSGHRRKYACEYLGIESIPTIVKELDRNEAVIFLVDSNLQRENILPSEKAFAYKLKMEALSHQGTSRQLGEKWSVSQISESSNESERQIHRYIRLTNLIPELLEFMDEGKMALSVGVELSFLDEQSQRNVLEQCEINDCTPSYAQAVRMRKAFSNFALTTDMIRSIMSEEKANQTERISFKVQDLRGFFPRNYTGKQMSETILKLLYENQRKMERRRNSRDER